ncbi:sodium-dependent transporter [Hydrogenothermus marinus]|uniref:SNF family Na+-dependent transporter n=1 Tax=Hydrogenothermus marinus TaxID=133270 RepID=A0A3M0BNT0_9AQUI|nr:sodium-dependent transporter [Hydrogenothermus marinus]RMA96075.1 SNF family Na+-dependent transporter [Hydrogenothermus marinus]
MIKREHWGSRIGLILAVAGNAIGLGNFLRFPVQAADNGGGAFMIPYMISLLVLGIPLLLVEWSLGRYGSVINHSTAPAIFNNLWKNPISKYIGILGIIIPLIVVVYYTYIESWTLLYSIFSLFGLTPSVSVDTANGEYLKPFKDFLISIIGANSEGLLLSPSIYAYIFFLITLLINLYILYRGITAGIEKVAKFALPAIFIMAIILMVRVFTLTSPDGRNFLDGLGFLWNPDFSALTDPKVWLAAAGQVFFTLSVGFGAIMVYASYIKPKDDIALNAISGASVNEFAEIILGGSIAITASVIFFGISTTAEIAHQGAFNLGFMALPAIFANIPFGQFFSFLWFLLLFFAGVTSSIALSQPAIAFLEDEFGFPRKKSVLILGLFLFISAHIPIFIKGALDELDFWVGTFGLILFALFEVLVFFWFFDSKKAWQEMTRDNDIKIPSFFYYLIKYIVPLILIVILISWGIDYLPKKISENTLNIWIARGFIVFTIIISILLVKYLWNKRGKQ